jgi:hypothetical protein
MMLRRQLGVILSADAPVPLIVKGNEIISIEGLSLERRAGEDSAQR